MDNTGKMHLLLESTIQDILRKFDMLLNRLLGYQEFKGFCECIGRHLTEKEFNEILSNYSSNESGLTLQGFMEFWRTNISEFRQSMGPSGDQHILQWLDNLGYDKDLYSVRSRSFVMTFHSEGEVGITVRDAIQTDLDARANILVINRFG